MEQLRALLHQTRELNDGVDNFTHQTSPKKSGFRKTQIG